MWIVTINQLYYPSADIYETYEEAKTAFEKADSCSCDGATVYLTEIKDVREIEGY